jgi:hypothetical protein
MALLLPKRKGYSLPHHLQQAQDGLIGGTVVHDDDFERSNALAQAASTHRTMTPASLTAEIAGDTRRGAPRRVRCRDVEPVTPMLQHADSVLRPVLGRRVPK